MESTCANCAAIAPIGARFCSQCGAALTGAGVPPTGTSQLRPVIVLFADLVDSTVLANQLDLEDLGILFDEFREAVRDAAARHSQPRIRFIGDGARLVFGYPDFDESTPEEAIRCALRLQAAAKNFAGARPGSAALRIGLAWGNAILTENSVETVTSQETVVGTVAHLASRLAAAASAGAVLVDTSLRDVAGAFFDFAALGPLQLKGFDEPVRAWQVLRETAIASRHFARRASADGSGALVGRDAELDRLRSAWAAARAGLGRAVVLIGEPGVGKSRLAHRLADDAVREGALLLELDCSPRTENAPLHPVRTLVRRLAGIQRDDPHHTTLPRLRDWLRSQFAGAPDDRSADLALAALEPDLTAPSAGAESAELLRRRSIRTLVDLVGLIAHRQPLLILVEDLQWSDPTTTALLLEWMADADRWRGLVLATARPEARSRLGAAAVEELWLQPLTPLQAEDLVAQLSAGYARPLSSSELHTIVERGEGVPLYLEELTRGTLDGRGAGVAPAADSGAVPATLQNIIQVRMDRWPEYRQSIQAAATLGREFSISLLAALTGRPAPAVEAMVSALVEDQLLVREPAGSGDRAAFRHALIHDAVYATLLRSERRGVHAAAADLLAGHAADLPEAGFALIAYHQAAAGRHRDAAASYLRAAGGTNAAAAYAETIAHARAGLDALASAGDASEDTLRRALLVQLGVALTARDGYAGSEVEQTYRQARQLCSAPRHGDDIYPIVRGLATFYLVKGDLAAAYELAREGLEHARRLGRPDWVIDALSVHGYASLYATRLAESDAMLRECLHTYAAEGGQRFRYPVPQDAGTAAWALLPTVQWLRGSLHEVELSVASGLAHVEGLDRPFDRAVLHSWIAGCRFTQRRFAEASEHARTSLALSSQFGYATWLGVSALLDALARAALAPDAGAVQQAGALMTSMAATGATLNAPYYLWALAKGLARLGQTEQALACLAQARQRAAAGGEHRMDSEIDLLEVELAPAKPDARLRLQQALQTADAQDNVLTALRIALTQATLWHPDAANRDQAAGELSVLDTAGALPAAGDWAAARLRHWRAIAAAPGAC